MHLRQNASNAPDIREPTRKKLPITSSFPISPNASHSPIESYVRTHRTMEMPPSAIRMANRPEPNIIRPHPAHTHA